LKSVDGNLKQQHKPFLKYVASFRKRNSTSIQFEIDGKHLIEPYDVAEEFSKHFQSVYNDLFPVVFPTLSSSSEFLSLFPLSYLYVFKATI
jgi:hypothetical protein